MVIPRTDVSAYAVNRPVQVYLWASAPADSLTDTARLLSRFRHARLTATVTAGPNLALCSWLQTVEEVHRLELAISAKLPRLQIIDRLMVLRTVKRMGRLLDDSGRAVGVVPINLRDDPMPHGRPGPVKLSSLFAPAALGQALLVADDDRTRDSAGDRASGDQDAGDQGETVTTRVPARLDRLPWSRWHWVIVIGLGTVWILDGLEVTVVGNISGQISKAGSGIAISQSQISGFAAAMYVLGACVGALFFGWLTDRFGRKKLFMITLLTYLVATALTALSFAPWWFFLFRFLTGFGIGGEYAAINSAIDELIPSRHRGVIDIVINGTYWAGAAAGALLTVPATNDLPVDVGWRICFGAGVVLGVVVLLVRRNVPESPRWMFIHGRGRAAEDLVDGIEERIERETGTRLPEATRSMTIRPRATVGFVAIAKTMFTAYPRRAILGFSLFIGQAFLYNAITFGYAQILATFFGVTTNPGYYFAVIAAGNLLGPLVLGRLFDTLGRKPMIAGTYLLSGLLLLLTALLFSQGLLSATTMTACWCGVLFFASAGASSAYLTVSEIFPMETRAMAIAFFYALGTGAGGIAGPLLFSSLVSTGKVADTVVAFCVGASLMIAAGLVEVFLGVRAERQGLEDIARPLSAADDTSAPQARAS
ncbi:MAG TPA: MFS transporter [Trebonia sp.]|nr:MFS transporter [Trebonia sp.]